MNRNEILFPICGISYGDIVDIAGKAHNMRDAAKRLGICESQFYKVMNSLDMASMFQNKRLRQSRVTREEIIELAEQGYTRKDTAFLLGIKYSYLKTLISRWELSKHFKLAKGQTIFIEKYGYCN